MGPGGWPAAWTRRSFLGAAGALLGAAAARAMPFASAVAPVAAAEVLRYRVVPEASQVRYRVREQLVGLSLPNDAVGATRAVEGMVALDERTGRFGPGSRITVDVRQLQSDEARRDNYIRRNTLETERYPSVVFVPVELEGIRRPLPTSAGAAAFRVAGDLTIRDATRRVTWEGTLALDGTQATIQAATTFGFEEFGLRVPRVSVVLGVEDRIRLEADLQLQRSA